MSVIIPVDFTSPHTYVTVLGQIVVGYLVWKLLVSMYNQPTALRGLTAAGGALLLSVLFCFIPAIVRFLYTTLG